MKLPLLAAALLALFAPLAHAEPPTESLRPFFQNLRAGKTQTVVVYGTSLTKYGAWVASLQDWFAEKYPGKVAVINSGGPGQNSTWGVAQLQAQVLDHHPDLVFIEFAANDAHTRFKLSVEQARKNLDGIVSAIRQQNPQAVIVLQTTNGFWDAPGGFKTAETDRPELQKYYDNYRQYAREHGLILLDTNAAWEKLKQNDNARFRSFLPDGTHPNKPGSLEITWPPIKALLEQANGG